MNSEKVIDEKSFNDKVEKNFDIKQKRGLVYNFAKGVNKILEITARMISDLIKLGYIKVAGVEDKIIHYVWVGDSLEWFLPEKH